MSVFQSGVHVLICWCVHIGVHRLLCIKFNLVKTIYINEKKSKFDANIGYNGSILRANIGAVKIIASRS